MSVVPITTAEEFALVGKGKIPALIDFHADWCGPCQKAKPTFARLAKEQKGVIGFFSLDIDKLPTVAKMCGVRSIPFFQGWREGKIVASWVGASNLDAEVKRLVDGVS